MFESDLPLYRVNSREANHWWRKNTRAGVLLDRLMLLFIVVPIALVVKGFYALSFLVFSLMIPYGLLLRQLAVRAVRDRVQNHPEERDSFEQAGIIYEETI